MTFPSLVPCHTSPNWRVLSAVAASPKMGPPDVKVYLNARPTSLPGVTCGSFSQTGDVVWSPSTQAAAKEEGKRATGCGSPLHLLYCYLLTQPSPSLSLSLVSLSTLISPLSHCDGRPYVAEAHMHTVTRVTVTCCASLFWIIYLFTAIVFTSCWGSRPGCFLSKYFMRIQFSFLKYFLTCQVSLLF